MGRTMRRLLRYSRLLLTLGLISACASLPPAVPNSQSALDPHGPAAAHIAQLWWLMLGFGTAIFLLVIGLVTAALLRGRRATSATPATGNHGDTGRNWPIVGGILLPLIVIGIVFGYSIYTLAAIENPAGSAALKIQVTGRRWWWEVNYPDQGIITANEIHIPAGVPVQLELQTADVIHSFWVPELHGKMDLIPTRTNDITIQADQVGVYHGQCAEFCGLEHALMGIVVVAQDSEDFNNWVAAQQAPAATPSDPKALQGQKVFESAGCVFCHTVRGLDDKSLNPSSVVLGPDLTHLHSRLTLAAATLMQTDGNLAGWVVDAQHTKPGSLMPNIYLSAQDLQALLAYLSTLR